MPTVLVIDDEYFVRKTLSVLLAPIAAVETAGTAQEAKEVAQRNPPDLVIADWMLSDPTDGLQLIESLRGSLPNLPVIMVSGYLPDHLHAQVHSIPNTWIFPKPCDFGQLKQKIETVLHSNKERDTTS